MKLSPELLEAAARWYVALRDADAADPARADWRRWLDADERHRHAWARMLALQERLGSVPGDLLLPTLSGARQQQRRRVLTLAMLAGGGALLAGYAAPPWRVLTAELRTATGERRIVTLPDGGTLYLNTASAIDIDYGPNRRVLRLHQGEVLVQTAPDPSGHRPFEVWTSDGSARALGTRYAVLREVDGTRVAVFQDAVLLRPTDPAAAPLRLEAGQQSRLTPTAAAAPKPVAAEQAAWVDGRLIAIDQPLGDFIAELARYRRGSLGCDPAVANLRLSGAFRLADTDAVLENVAASLPVALQYRTRYWVRIVPR